MSEEKTPRWQRKRCFCGELMRYLGTREQQETEAREVLEWYEDDAEFVVKDVTFMTVVDVWRCPNGHEDSEYPIFRNPEGDE